MQNKNQMQRYETDVFVTLLRYDIQEVHNSYNPIVHSILTFYKIYSIQIAWPLFHFHRLNCGDPQAAVIPLMDFCQDNLKTTHTHTQNQISTRYHVCYF